MSLGQMSDLETFSTVLTKDQVRRLRAIKNARSAAHRRVSMADVARDVVEAGLVVISLGQNSVISASTESESPNGKETAAA